MLTWPEHESLRNCSLALHPRDHLTAGVVWAGSSVPEGMNPISAVALLQRGTFATFVLFFFQAPDGKHPRDVWPACGEPTCFCAVQPYPISS